MLSTVHLTQEIRSANRLLICFYKFIHTFPFNFFYSFRKYSDSDSMKSFAETSLPKNDLGEVSTKDHDGAVESVDSEEFLGEEVGKEVLIGGDTEDNRSARGSIRERHLVKTFSEVSKSIRNFK